jgi:protein phosphatase 1 regulatory subunit 7
LIASPFHHNISHYMTTEPFDVSHAAGRSTLWLDSARIDACLAYYAAEAIDELAISPSRGYRAPDLEPLRGRAELRALTIVSPPAYDFDVGPLVGLPNLRSLTASFPIHVPLSSWPRLELFRGYWTKTLRLEEARGLCTLDLSGYKPKSKDLSELPSLPLLVDLALVQANVTSLAGLSAQLPQLERLKLTYMRALGSIAEVARLPALDTLYCDVCRKLADAPAALSGHPRLRVVALNDCGALPDLQFVRTMPRLDDFRFVNTNVVDGDLTPLIGLANAGFLPKRHYSHTPEALRALLRPED